MPEGEESPERGAAHGECTGTIEGPKGRGDRCGVPPRSLFGPSGAGRAGDSPHGNVTTSSQCAARSRQHSPYLPKQSHDPRRGYPSGPLGQLPSAEGRQGLARCKHASTSVGEPGRMRCKHTPPCKGEESAQRTDSTPRQKRQRSIPALPCLFSVIPQTKPHAA